VSWADRISPVHAGDKVAYARRFLQSIGCHIGGMASARGQVTAIEPMGEAILARVNWDTPDLPDRVDIQYLRLVKNGIVTEHG
jgi:hypothetical protein